MLRKCLTILPTLLLILGAYADEKDVLELTDETFESELERHENTLVMFYAPWWDRSFPLSSASSPPLIAYFYIFVEKCFMKEKKGKKKFCAKNVEDASKKLRS